MNTRKILITLPALLMLAIIDTCADGGMWTLGDLTPQTYAAMRSYGFKLTPGELSGNDGTSLRNAVVLFGGFCSGVVVSHDGLVLTNHHCGFGSIRELSDPQHDYIKNGFVAYSAAEELPVPGLYVSFPLREVRVTDRVLQLITEKDAAEITHQRWGQERNKLLDSIQTVLVKETIGNDSTLWAEMKSYYGSNEFYLTVYRIYTDVRLVLAPPSSLGKFGGETDNWMWPRETCDFSVFRIYAGKDNLPADYNKDNVPYKPARVAQVSLDGYKAGDFAMTLGFPGSTYRYKSSYSIENRVRSINTPVAESGNLELPIWKEAMKADPAVRLKYDSKYSNFSNFHKNSIGMNRSIATYDIVGQKRNFERTLDEWINADDNRQKKYGDVLEKLHQAYDTYTPETEKFYKGYFLLNYNIDIALLSRTAASAAEYKRTGNKQIDKLNIDSSISDVRSYYNDSDIPLELRTLAAALRRYKEDMPEEYHPAFFKTVSEQYGGNFTSYIRDIAAHSCIPDSAKTINHIKRGKSKQLQSDPLVQLSVQIRDCVNKARKFESGKDLSELERRLTQATREMYESSPLYSDANMTLRMSYGTIKTYTPTGGNEYPLYTTPQTLAAKAATAHKNSDYAIENNVLSLVTAGNYGKYTDKTSKNLQLCFITDNDITGGNSGSPIFNGQGQVIGLAFDGNWESMANDFRYNPELTRCIGVDIRYVMYVIDKWAGAGRLLDEIAFAH